MTDTEKQMSDPKSLDIDHIAKLARIALTAEDVPQPSLPVDVALKSAPARRDNMIVVPKVVE
jgi:Asp-tRNA(Asn)/Glu-tRNA(Gln) amidotransferase C subunit